jgi:hypothetical protein
MLLMQREKEWLKMSQTNTYNFDATSVSVPSRLSPASTHPSKNFVIDVVATAAEPGTRVQDFLEELVWDNVFNTPHVKRSLRNLAAKALQEFAAGETEEGGFSVE